MRKRIVISLCTCMVLTLAACTAKTPETKEVPAAQPAETETVVETLGEDEVLEEGEIEEIANPWTDCASMEEAEKIAGFASAFGDKIGEDSWTACEFRAMEGMLDVNYTYYDVIMGIRQAPGEGQDVSGIYEDYGTTNTIEDCGTSITMCGEDDLIYLTIFSYDGYSYAIYTLDGDLDINICEVISAMTGVASKTVEEYEPGEGAPIAEDDRYIDDEEVLYGDLSGAYEAEDGTRAFVSIYTSMDDNTAEIGNVEIEDKDGNILISGNLIPMVTNLYEIQGTPATLSVYTEDEVLHLDYYQDGNHIAYYTMTDHVES